MLFISGYEDVNCELDVDECEAQPCENDGVCFQRSDSRHYRVLPELDTDFSYESAAGYLCQCRAGFTGEIQRWRRFVTLRRSRAASNRSFSVSQVTTVQLTWTNVSPRRVKTEAPVKISSMRFSARVLRGSQVCECAAYTTWLHFRSFTIMQIYQWLNVQHIGGSLEKHASIYSFAKLH